MLGVEHLQIAFALIAFIFSGEAEPWRIARPTSPMRKAAPLPKGYSYKTYYYEQQLDHFGFGNDKTYKQRYLLADQFWNRKGGPIFFYTGNEGDIELFCNNTGFMWDIAPKFKALLVFAEHRYYGKSLPFGSKTFQNNSNLNFLTSEQALADFAQLITQLKATTPGASKSSVVAFGGSYGGMLAAWLRMKYPNVVVGSLASSAPAWALPGLSSCNNFLDVVSAHFNSTSRQCADNIRAGWYTIESVASGMVGGYKLISNTFHLCSPLQSKYDLGPFMDFLMDTYVQFAEVDYPYPASFLADLPAWPIKVACSYLSKPLSGEALLAALANVTNLFYNYTGSAKCLNWTSGGSTPGLGYSGWSYQVCTEMVMPMCSNNTGMFYNIDWDFDAYSDICYSSYKVRPRQDWVSLEYWAKKLKTASNIIFSNGLYDPWSSGGVLQTISETVVAIQIPHGAHHLDLRSSNPNDTRGVIAAREQEVNIIRGWLGLTQ